MKTDCCQHRPRHSVWTAQSRAQVFPPVHLSRPCVGRRLPLPRLIGRFAPRRLCLPSTPDGVLPCDAPVPLSSAPRSVLPCRVSKGQQPAATGGTSVRGRGRPSRVAGG